MKKLILILFISFPSYLFLFCTGSASETNKNLNSNMVVMELFTSQGCSSCPLADRLLGKYANDENVIALSFHVDYWNRLGWKDPFSNPDFSQRQKQYAQIFKLSGIYTPQLIINGETEMVGSNANKISTAVKKMQQLQPTAHISIDKVISEGNTANVTYTLQGVQSTSTINIALVQSKATTSIKAGENTGLQLTNYNVVRSFKSLPVANGTNTVSVNLIPGEEKKDYRIVAFIQNSTSYKIPAAAKSAL